MQTGSQTGKTDIFRPGRWGEKAGIGNEAGMEGCTSPRQSRRLRSLTPDALRLTSDGGDRLSAGMAAAPDQVCAPSNKGRRRRQRESDNAASRNFTGAPPLKLFIELSFSVLQYELHQNQAKQATRQRPPHVVAWIALASPLSAISSLLFGLCLLSSACPGPSLGKGVFLAFYKALASPVFPLLASLFPFLLLIYHTSYHSLAACQGTCSRTPSLPPLSLSCPYSAAAILFSTLTTAL
ncbi:hypothetical protein TESG_08143 [Trichophyton tonsurans CBS 112818]|uniref:Uncharacterized protein n=1 Tax=Trichophyton tonsurans (strain CBS 112818) TaxID=647933 RepID=F2SB88_TRIT1|nr:hypothetical protein TESG_08143 [Trichophyton tonsurans CBS 112818]